MRYEQFINATNDHRQSFATETKTKVKYSVDGVVWRGALVRLLLFFLPFFSFYMWGGNRDNRGKRTWNMRCYQQRDIGSDSVCAVRHTVVLHACTATNDQPCVKTVFTYLNVISATSQPFCDRLWNFHCMYFGWIRHLSLSLLGPKWPYTLYTSV